MGYLPQRFLTLLILLLSAKETFQNSRNKRQIQPEQPRILTNNGHLVFQTGTNHNITFRSTTGGYINVNGENLATMSQMVKDNKQAIDQLRTSPATAAPGGNLESRVTTVENRLNNLQPTGAVQTSLLTLGHRIDLVQATMPQNAGSRLTTVEQRLDNLQATGQVQTTLADLTSRLSTVESRVTVIESSGGNDLQDLMNTVRSLQTTVTNLQNLLTTNECASNPCRNGATCVDTYNGFFCRCTAAFQGPNCDDDVNECAVYAGTDLGCQNGATCVNTIGSFRCTCTANWHGVRCTESHDDCTGASQQELCGQGTCVNNQRVTPGQPKYTCICNEGWTTAGSDPACVVDVDECQGSRPPCSQSPMVPCINLPGSFTCGSCPAGYTGNGFTCADVNECAVNNGGCSLAPRVDCINTEGSRTCGPCPQGYQGNGVTCTWVGLCQDNNGGCHPQATCSESSGVGGRTCTCPQGYVGNGIGPAGCVAQGPTTGPCGSNPCMNGAACQNVDATNYRCSCQAGYTGQRCETNVDECASNPCQNGGTCIDRVDGYACQCTSAFSGPNCVEEQQSCGGAITSEAGSFSYPTVPGAQYPHGVSCAWRITTVFDKILMVTFPSFSLESHPNCAYDYLQIHDGPTASSFMVGKYCGTTAPNGGSLNSTHNQMYFWFRSDASIASDGFTVQWTSAEPSCGGNLAGTDHGEFSSPGYPGNYPHNRDCIWTVSVSPGNNIMFTFATLAIETHPDCNYDYLEIRDGLLDSSPLLRRYCNTTTPPPLTTTGPTAWIKFHTDASLDDQGFHITYAAVSADPQCGGTYTSETGVLISPNYPNPYNHDASCIWVITVHERDTLTLTFTNMDLEGHPDCNFDYVEVRDGPNENAPLLGRYCANDIPTPLTTSQNILFVKFRSDISVATSGFRATWAVACGGTFTAPTGLLRSPYFPDPYPSNRECTYLISQADGMRIRLTFSSFDVESAAQGDCIYDYLQVYDGGSESSPQLGSFCGASVPPVQLTTGNLMYLKFVTDGSVQNQGFEATYEVTEGGCGGVLTETTGTFQSPGHPNVYPHGANCTWNINVDPGLVIRLTFNTFSMESHRNCAYDSVSIYDNSSAVQSSLLGSYCGSTTPPVLTSTNNVLTIQLISDVSLAYEGFTASYVALNASTLCGNQLVESSGIITSPGFPLVYPHERECVWTIVAPEGNQIFINITDFSIESHPNCQYDFLEIRNGGFASSPLVGVYCGSTVDTPIVSHSNRMYIKFKTDASVSFAGFRLQYDTTATGCGADLTTPTGSFQSPNYPMPYGHNAECFYQIVTSRGSTIQLSMIDIDIEFHQNCVYDYIEVRDDNQLGRLIGRYCGQTVPDPVMSKSNVMWVKYRTDMSVSGRGFHAFYASICNNRLTDRNGVIESPNFPDPYPHNRNCTWIIETTLGNTVNFSFSHFDIESHSDCRYDYLQIRDGDAANSNLLGTFCGNNLPAPMASTGEHVWLNFLSDFSVASNGFRLEYVTDGCGGFLTEPTGTFTSPNYPNPYPHRRICEWQISVAMGSYIQFTIEDFDVEAHQTCDYDALEVYGGPDDTATLLVKLCHTQTQPQVLSTTGNLMFVRFKSDMSVSGKGFKASYKTATGGCGGNYTTPSGTLVSQNFPNPYPHNTDCTWLITVAEGRTVVLNFTDFDVEGAADCRYDYVAVYDGPDNTYPELFKHCGNSLPVPSLYRSSTSQLYVRMTSDQSVAGQGFKAEYVTGCGGVLSAETDGSITSPNYPANYPRASNCSWLITSDHAADRITVLFTHMDLELADGCAHDYVRVLDGNDDQAPEVGRFCGTTVPTPITSQGMALYVQFVSDNSVQQTGFRATYTKSTSACGGDFTAENGAFTSPGYPNSYPGNTECVWTIQVPPGNKVEISFSFFNLEYHSNCNYDYLEMHEGELGGPLIGRFCGNNMPTNLTAYDGIWIKFRSDASGTGQGFVAQYSSTYGGDLTGTSGQVASPRYPNPYPHNVDYVWTITVATGMKIRVTFVTMDMESSFNSECRFDYLMFRDGGSAESPEMNRFCGITLPDMFISTTNQLRVEFHSDWSSTGQGFLFSWQATSEGPITTTPPTAGTTPASKVVTAMKAVTNNNYPTHSWNNSQYVQYTCLITTTPPTAGTTQVPGCGGTLTVAQSVQTLTSPGYPGNYMNRLNCTWVMYAPLGFKVWMNITDIDIESHSTCYFDALTVYDWPAAIQLGQFCGRQGNDQPLVSSRTQAILNFKTDFSLVRPGFSLQYKAVCGGIIQTSNGVLTSPGYPGNYEANQNCSWSIQVQTGRTIRVQFDSNFNIPGTPGSCGGDYVMLLNGYSSTSPPLGPAGDGRYCGNTAPFVNDTSSYFLYVNFISDGSGFGPGFSLTFTEVTVTCGGQLTLTDAITSGIFTSPNYPQAYPHNVDCSWIITAPAAERIQVDFLETFSIESHAECRWDYIELRDGGTINAPSLGRLCGYSIPSTVVTTGNVLFARFRTDASVPRVGFKAQYKIATCGGRLAITDSSSISSPNYPSNYENNADCIWVISGPTGHYLSFSFTAFTLQNSANCSAADFLEIRDLNSTGPVLLSACGSSLPQPVLSSDNTAIIRFKTDASGVAPGFTLNVQASVEVCGGDLTTPTGTIQSPNFPGNYPHSRICTWRITVPYGRRITFTFDSFNIEGHTTCRYDFVSVYNGILPDSTLVGFYCGDTPPAVVETSGNTARVVFRTDASVTNGGFRASYTSNNEQACGGALTTSPGNITSPGYGTGNYSNGLECVWTLSNYQAINSSVVMRFNDLQLEPHTSCLWDFLEIKEGSTSSGIVLDRFCGNNTLPSPLISPSPNIWMRFRTDTSIVDRGFSISYNFTQCGGILTDPVGVIASPNYPNQYDHNDACAWQIVAPPGTQIIVEFSDFQMENHPSCFFDYLEIFNGPYASSPSINRYCGDTMPSTFKSQSNSVRLVFFTDISQSARGFRLTYRFSTQGCGGLLHSAVGYLSTPEYPSSYPHNVECEWDINVGPGYIVSLIFNPPFDLEVQGDCIYDYVEVSDVLSNGSLVSLGRWCHNAVPPPLTSTGSRMVVKFRSDASTNGNGFSANWTADCGGLLSDSQGLLLSPGFPGNYGNNLRCNYTIAGDPQHYVILQFDPDNFNIEAGTNCPYDYLSVYSGNSSSSPQLGQFCGNTAPQAVSALGAMYVQFWTDASLVYTGFRAAYRISQCGGVYTEPSGLISTPTTPVNYHNNQNCSWYITVATNRIVELRFLMFDLEVHSQCNYDFVEVRDGPNLTSPLIGRFCGTAIPDTLRSTSNTMTVNFVTDISVTRAGFQAAYRTSYGPAQGCGGVLNATSGQFSSLDSDSDGNYENNLNCGWTIMGGDNKVIQLSIRNMDIEAHPNCFYDYLAIYDGISMDDQLIGKYCGGTPPAVFTSTSNVLFVQFYTDSSVVARGFNASYTQQDSLCGGTFTASTTPRIITSPGYPSPFPQGGRCRWTVDAPSDTQQVHVVVTAINLRNTTGCSTEYLEIKDYPQGLQGRTVHACGTVPPPMIDSYGRTLQINYAALPSSGSTGFSLTFQITSCNRTYTGDRGQIFSPGWPGPYPRSVNCEMLLQGPPGTTISLYFNEFHIEPHSSCNYDYLEIRNGSTNTSASLGRLCGWILPDPVFASTNAVWMNFRTDQSVAYRGYDISYTATTQGIGCGGNLIGINGSLTSPGYPGNYTESRTCTWSIAVPARRVVALTFTDMRMFDAVNCATDYVIVYNGASDSAPIFGRFCGGEIPAAMTTSSNSAFVKFVSDGVGTSIGFRMTFTS